MARQYYLAKTDPDTYTVRQLAAEGRTVWDGVRNPQAVQAIRSMKVGDRVFIYHSGGESAVAGLAAVSGAPVPDESDPKSWKAGFEFIAYLDPAVTLREIKESGLFGDWSLVRNSRLSTMAAPAEFVSWMRRKFPKVKI